MKTVFRVATVLALGLTVAAVPLRNARAIEDEGGGYSFNVTNASEKQITKLLASEDGKTYRDFDIGAAIAPNKTVTLKWDKKTEGAGCKWYLKAVFADGKQSEAWKVDLCVEEIEIFFYAGT